MAASKLGRTAAGADHGCWPDLWAKWQRRLAQENRHYEVDNFEDGAVWQNTSSTTDIKKHGSLP